MRLQFLSRSRGRNVQQGILVGESALERAENECLADAQQRATRCSREELRRVEHDRDLAVRMTDAILGLFPGCPPEEARAIALHTVVRGSGRVGRTSAGRSLETEALTAAVLAAVRHNSTNYDQLLMSGWSQIEARVAIRDAVGRAIDFWRVPPV